MDSSERAAPPACELASSRGALGRFALWLLHRAGWAVIFAQPIPAKCVIVFAPHTSNWDFLIGLLAKWAMDLKVRFAAKDSLFATPFAPLLVRWGGIPVNRRARTGFIERMREEFARNPDFRLTIAPEGTRSYASHWKSGFYHLALAVGKPIALAFIDYERKRIGIGGYLELTGDAAADIARVAAFYADKRGRNPRQQGPVRFDAP